MADSVDEIKSRLGIEEVVSQYVQLKKAGRNLKGLCPFHSEKTPSFVVSPEKQICHCFGCNKGGDIFTFVQEVEGVSFVEAMEILADRAGIKIDTAKFQKKAPKSEKDIYFKAHDLACEFFEKQLYSTNDGKKVLEYLYKRGLKDETIKEFRLGFAPDKYDELYPYLLKKSISRDVLIKSGLVSAKNLASDSIYDKYRSRLMFPIFNHIGKICGFGGRALKHDQMPKYLNSPGNIIYSKSSVLYGLFHSKKYIKEEDQIVLVEGYFDVILPYQAGVKNIVASSGTALSNEQMRIIKRLTGNVVTCFDTDDAGMEATKRAYLLFQNEGVSVKTVTGMDQKDPADFVLSNCEKFRDLVKTASDFISFFISMLISKNDVDNLTGRRKIINELLPYFQAMSPATRDFCVRECAQKLKMQEQHLYDEIQNYKLPHDHPVKQSLEISGQVQTSRSSASEIISSLILEYPFLFEILKTLIKFDDFVEEFKDVYRELTEQYNAARGNFKEWDFDSHVLFQNKEKINVLRLSAEEKYLGFSEEALKIEMEKLVDKIKKDRKIRRLAGLQRDVAEAEKSQQKEKLKILLEEQQRLLQS